MLTVHRQCGGRASERAGGLAGGHSGDDVNVLTMIRWCIHLMNGVVDTKQTAAQSVINNTFADLSGFCLSNQREFEELLLKLVRGARIDRGGGGDDADGSSGIACGDDGDESFLNVGVLGVSEQDSSDERTLDSFESLLACLPACVRAYVCFFVCLHTWPMTATNLARSPSHW